MGRGRRFIFSCFTRLFGHREEQHGSGPGLETPTVTHTALTCWRVTTCTIVSRQQAVVQRGKTTVSIRCKKYLKYIKCSSAASQKPIGNFRECVNVLSNLVLSGCGTVWRILSILEECLPKSFPAPDTHTIDRLDITHRKKTKQNNPSPSIHDF